jgi:hypothetical protein
MSSCCSRAMLMFGSDFDLSGKMLVECYLAEDSCVSSDKGEEKEEVGSEEYLLRQCETAMLQYSTTTPATKWRQVPWKPKAYRHMVVVEKEGVEGSQRKSLQSVGAGAVLMHVTRHPAGPYRLRMKPAC